MKLATRYQRINLIATLSIFLLASAVFYVLLYRLLVRQIDEELEIEQHEIESYISRFAQLPQNIVPVEDQMVLYEKIGEGQPERILRSLDLYDIVEEEAGHFRQLVFTAQVGAQWYRVSVSKSLDGTLHLAKSIAVVALGTVLLMLLISFLINRIILRKLWRTFYVTIEKVRSFQLGRKEALSLPRTTIDEFALLNAVLGQAIGTAARDYHGLKEFTENAAHELQTPLAILRSKLDILIQDAALSENQSKVIQDAYEAIRRMSHLNSSLLMLAKIENGQFPESSIIDLKEMLQQKVEALDAFIQNKEIDVQATVSPVFMRMSPVLADVMFNNLLSNAIQHNYSGGILRIMLAKDALIVCNTSDAKSLESDYLFHRFHKQSSDATGTGLGLAITKQICDAYGFAIEYQYDAEALHCFTIHWKR